MFLESDVLRVLSKYPADCQPERIEPLGGAGGFSGAELWQLQTPCGALCLRCWPPEHPTREGLQFIHSVLAHVARSGLSIVPVPRTTRSGDTWVSHDGKLWELAPWLPGEANFQRQPTLQKLQGALQSLARFHTAAADFPRETTWSPAPGIARRLEQLRRQQSGGLEELSAAVSDQPWPEFAARARSLLAIAPTLVPHILQLLRRAEPLSVALQPCIRDVWCDHVLFEGGRVSGLVDFGSMQIDNVATDIARLLGSMAHDRASWWQAGLDAYREIRRLSEEETFLIIAYDRSSVVISGINWVDWVFREHRHFVDREAVIRRVDVIIERLRALGRSTGDG